MTQNFSKPNFGFGRPPRRGRLTRGWSAFTSPRRPIPPLVPPEPPRSAPSADTILKNLQYDDGGMYTDEEDEVQQTTLSYTEIVEEKVVLTPSTLGETPIMTARTVKAVESVTLMRTSLLGECKSCGDVALEPVKCAEIREDNDINANICNKLHYYYGIREFSDVEFVCDRYVFHAHRQVLEHFVENLELLLSGTISDWLAVRRICEVLYYHRIEDEQFLMCSRGDPRMTRLWEEGSAIMHLGNKLGIHVVRKYMDRAVRAHCCENFRTCQKCQKHRKLFAAVFDLNEAKSSFEDSPTNSHALDDPFADVPFIC